MVDFKEEPLEMRINALSPDTSMREVVAVVADVFAVHFGATTDAERLKDIEREQAEFHRALTRRDRVDEYGDVLASLFAFADEQSVDPIEALRDTLKKIAGRADLYAARGDKKNVAIYGGSFDPPHLGHVAVMQAILASAIGIQEVWVMPSNEPMGSKRLTEPRHRAAMCRLLERIDPRIKFFGYEIDNGLSSETRRTLMRLLREPFANTHRLHAVVSCDVANSIPSWEGSDELMRMVPFITLPRPGYQPDLANPWYLQSPHRYLSSAEGLIQISSTDLRTAYASGNVDRAAALMTPDVHAYIVEQGLYGATRVHSR